MDTNDEHLPTIPTLDVTTINIPSIPSFSHNPAHTEVAKNDIEIATMQLQGLMAGWAMPGLTVGRMTRLIDATIKAVKHRRDVLGMPYGYIDQNTKRVSFEPLD